MTLKDQTEKSASSRSLSSQHGIIRYGFKSARKLTTKLVDYDGEQRMSQIINGSRNVNTV